MVYNQYNYCSVSYQLIDRKGNQIFYPLEYLIESTLASIQQVEYVE